MGLLLRLQAPSGAAAQPFTLGLFLSGFLFQLTTAALSEEPLFRGFLLEWLRGRGLGPWTACLIQAALFMLAHSYYLADGRYLSFFAAFGAGVLLGILSWKSRSLSYPVIAHALINAVANIVQHTVL